MMFKKVLLLGLLFFLSGEVFAQEKIAIWKGTNTKNGNLVSLMPFVAENDTCGVAVIVCPGGSYYWLDEIGEGEDVARWLQSKGITAFVLRYRTAGVGAFLWHYRGLLSGRQHPDMITDAQRALQWVREHAKEYHIDPEKVGMMGFSAGGHLVMSAACFFHTDFLKMSNISNEENLRPAFVAPIYPVVTMKESCTHKRSRCALLGDSRHSDIQLRDSLSLERHIPKDCPPVFIVNCIDDPVVDYHNSVLLDSALTAANINHRYIQYQTGGHGFGASEVKGSEECRAWKNAFLNWINELNL